jgi:hypothetical protein
MILGACIELFPISVRYSCTIALRSPDAFVIVQYIVLVDSTSHRLNQLIQLFVISAPRSVCA